MSKDLKKNFISGVKWTGISKFGTQGMQLVTTFILARLLSPSDFGLLGLANVFLLIANQINQLGISAAIIQQKDPDEGYLSSAFWTNVLVGLFLTVFVFFLSWPAALFFNNETLRSMMQVLSLVYLFGSLRVVQNALFTKKLQFKKLTVIEIISVGISSAASIGLALAGVGVWSLVCGQLIYVIINMVLVWGLSSWRPAFIFEKRKFDQFFSFGVKVMGTNIMSSTSSSLSAAIIGRFLSITSVGIFNMSMNIIYFPSRITTMILSSVMFPILSHMQDDNERLRAAYFNILKVIATVVFPALMGMACIAPEFVKVVLGDMWLGIINPVRMLFIVGMIDSLVGTVGSIFCSKGRPGIEMKAEFGLLVMLFPMLLLGLKFGLTGIIIAIIIHRFISIITFFLLMRLIIKYNAIEILTSLFTSFRYSIVMGFVVMAYRAVFRIFLHNDVILLFTSMIIGASLYCVLLRFLDVKIYMEFKGLIIANLKSTFFRKFRVRRAEPQEG